MSRSWDIASRWDFFAERIDCFFVLAHGVWAELEPFRGLADRETFQNAGAGNLAACWAPSALVHGDEPEPRIEYALGDAVDLPAESSRVGCGLPGDL